MKSPSRTDVSFASGSEPNTLAHRIRQLRCAKGWGPDDLAARAKISRTALYQIETGKTTHPRAGTLLSISRALGVEADDLFQTSADPQIAAEDLPPVERVPQPAALRFEEREEHLDRTTVSVGQEPPRWMRDLEIESKFRRLLASPFRDGLARIVEQTYLLLPPETRDRSN